jgi:hypothetical protein
MEKKKKKITLNRELIRQLRDAEMVGAVGGVISPCDAGTDSVPGPMPCNPG